MRIRAYVTRLDGRPNMIVINAGPCRTIRENYERDWTPDALPLGFTFTQLILLQWRPDLTGDFLPVQLWDINLRIIASSEAPTDLGILFPGMKATITLDGDGFSLIAPALARVPNQTMELGML